MPVLFGAAGAQAAEAEAPDLVRALELKPGSAILDVFCGPGRLAWPLAGLGYHVIGVDRTDLFIGSARSATRGTQVAVGPKAAGKGTSDSTTAAQSSPTGSASLPGPTGSASFYRVEFSDEGPFDDSEIPTTPLDGAIWAGLSTGYAGLDFDRVVLEWIRPRLRPGSPLLIEVSTLEDLKDPGFETVEWFEDRSLGESEADAVWRLRHALRETGDDGGCFEGAWSRFQLGSVEEFRFRYQIYSQSHWVDILTESGFSDVRFENHLDEFDPGGSSVSRPRERAQSWIRARTSA